MEGKKVLKSVGNSIRKIRTEKKISQTELALMCNFENSRMSRIESGQANTTILTLWKVSRALDTNLSDLFDGH